MWKGEVGDRVSNGWNGEHFLVVTARLYFCMDWLLVAG